MTGPRSMDMGPVATSPVAAAPSDAPRSPNRVFFLDNAEPDVDVDEHNPSPERQEREPKRRKFLPTLPAVPAVTLVLPNIGSTARDHLASERTWLAYVRTSLGVASTGVALVQLFTIALEEEEAPSPNDAKIQRFARPLGAATVLFGLYVLTIGVHRYFRVQRALTRGEFPVARVTVLGISGLLAALVAITFGILVAVTRDE